MADRPEESWDACVVAAINNSLEAAMQEQRDAELVREIGETVNPLV